MHLFIKYIPILFLVLQSCSENTPLSDTSKIYLSGQVTGLADTSLQFSFESFKLLDSSDPVDIKVDSTGQFNLILDTQYPLKGFLSFGKVPRTYKFDITLIDGKDTSMQVGSVDFRIIYLYLSPGDSLTLSVDPDGIQTSLSFQVEEQEITILLIMKSGSLIITKTNT